MPSRMTIHNLQLYVHHAEALGTKLICTHTCMYTASLILKLYAGMSLMVCVCISCCKWWMLCRSGKICCMHVCLHFMLQVMDAGKDNQVCVCACMRACVCVCVRACVCACVHACVRACIVPPLTSFPAGRESSFESCIWWGLPTALSQCLQRTQCDRCIPTSCADRSPANYI